MGILKTLKSLIWEEVPKSQRYPVVPFREADRTTPHLVNKTPPTTMPRTKTYGMSPRIGRPIVTKKEFREETSYVEEIPGIDLGTAIALDLVSNIAQATTNMAASMNDQVFGNSAQQQAPADQCGTPIVESYSTSTPDPVSYDSCPASVPDSVSYTDPGQ